MASLTVKKMNSVQIKFFLILFILYRPEYVMLNEYIDLFVNILRIIVTIVLCIKVIAERKTKVIIFPFVIWGGFNLYCLLNETWSFSVLIEWAIIIDIFAFVGLYLETNSYDLYISLSRLLFVYGICNTATIFMGNAYENLFLGFDNDIIMRIIPLLGVELYLSFIVHDKLSTFDYIIYLIYLIDYLITFSASGILALVILLFMVFSKKLTFKYINSKNCIIVSILLWVMLYIFKIQNYLFYLLGMLKKDMTLSYRTYIWKSVLVAIKESPLIGYGNIMNSEIYYNIVRPIYYASVAPHNLWLYIVASGGVIGLVVIVYFFIKSFKNVDKNYGNKKSKVLIATFLAYLVCGEFASYYAIEYICLLLAVASKVKDIED